MVKRCEAVGVSIYADAVINHMAAGSSGTGVDGTSYTTRDFPGCVQHPLMSRNPKIYFI